MMILKWTLKRPRKARNNAGDEAHKILAYVVIRLTVAAKAGTDRC